MRQITVHGYAKVNLTLGILFKRNDGYHEIESIMQKLDLSDDVLIEDRPDGRIRITSDNPDVPQYPAGGSLNTAARAAEILKSRYAPARGADIFIRKRIPVAAGLGGGSSDAAACLLGLTRLWDLEVDPGALAQIGAEVGSDVPFALASPTAVVGGRGEWVTEIAPPPPFWMALLKPAQAVLAADAYAEYDAGGGGWGGDGQRVLDGIASGDLRLLGAGMGNALQAAVERLVPEVAGIVERLGDLGSPGVVVSGSGPTVGALAFDRGHAGEMLAVFEGEPGIEWAAVCQSLS